MSDYIVRATAADSQIRAFATTSRNTVEYARQIHHTTPVATAALGRLLTAGAIMGTMMKGDRDILTLQIKGEGPIGGITVTADSSGRVKGYVNHPEVYLPANEKGKLDVSSAIGAGMLSVIKDLGLKEPYVGQTVLQTGEIAEDLTYYFASSEQIPSSVGLGVLMGQDHRVKQAGGFMVQLMPFTDEKLIDALEKKLANVKSVTSMLDQGMTPEKILEEMLGEFGLELHDTLPVEYYCGCGKERVEKALISVGEQELKQMIGEGKPVELHCHFCNTNYEFSVAELETLLGKCRV